ncbi:MAG TPA: hypothetical protein PLW86_09265 [Rhodocyclaceae bacterium]|nr:hypothetical protein [Rhodocyclaceae bacterium]
MRLNSLSGHARTLTREAASRARAAERLPHRYVGEVEGIEADRNRSAGDDLEAARELPIATPVIDPEQLAREIASQLRRLGPLAIRLLMRPRDYAVLQIDAVV